MKGARNYFVDNQKYWEMLGVILCWLTYPLAFILETLQCLDFWLVGMTAALGTVNKPSF